MLRPVDKVLVYLTRGEGSGRQLLVFEHVDHPSAGIQVPAGTVEPGEALEVAARREVREEAGLELPATGRFIGRFEYPRMDRQELHLRHVFHFPVSGITDSWLHCVSGQGEDKGLVLRYYWLPLAQAAARLAVGQGSYLEHI